MHLPQAFDPTKGTSCSWRPTPGRTTPERRDDATFLLGNTVDLAYRYELDAAVDWPAVYCNALGSAIRPIGEAIHGRDTADAR